MAMRKPGVSNKGDSIDEYIIAEIREIFSLFDKDADGFVQTSDLGTMIRGLNFNPSETEVAEMVKEVDPEGRGSFNQNSLVSLIGSRRKPVESLQDMIEALRVVSAEEVSMEKGAPQPKLSVEFLKQQLKKLGKEKGENLQEPQIDKILTDCKLVHEDSMIIEDFAKYLISR